LLPDDLNAGRHTDSVVGVADVSQHRSPPAFIISAVFGLVGLVLFAVGLATAAEGFYLAGVAAGVISLIAALVWREELILAWHAKQNRRPSQD